MRVISFYLPQFHRVKENDEWWGEGFTDWIPTKSATPLFDGHYQPHEPLDDNYYDLGDIEVLRWQSELMHKYDVDGQAFYHYWFKDGVKILEKPAENLLNNKSINMQFCFYWANEPWVRSWSKIKQGANVWLDGYHKKSREDDDGILMMQDYGSEKEWRVHFKYLLPFFKDERYITVENKPIFIIYRPGSIPELCKMKNCFEKWAQECGLNGVYFIGAYINESNTGNGIDAQLIHEPLHSNIIFKDIRKDSNINRFDYDEEWKYILNEYKDDYKTYYSGFSGYDDSPRRGNKGIVVQGSTPEKFNKYLCQLMAKNEACGTDITFVNAWNEWGEGMYLEPDKKYGTGYLEAIKSAKEQYKEYIKYYSEKIDSFDNNISIIRNRCDKFELYTNFLDAWMSYREQGINLSKWFERHSIRRILIYGYGIMGKHLFTELKDTPIEVAGIIDKQKNTIRAEVPTYLPEEALPVCDAIIVSSFYFFDEIKNALSTDIDLISLKTVLNEIDNTMFAK